MDNCLHTHWTARPNGFAVRLTCDQCGVEWNELAARNLARDRDAQIIGYMPVNAPLYSYLDDWTPRWLYNGSNKA